MTLSYDETKDLIDLVLNTTAAYARDRLHENLRVLNHNEPEFYTGIIEHGPGMKLTSEQWFDLLSKLPARTLRNVSTIMNKLSKAQREKLPPATLG
jgi:hypothetical protein